MVYIPVCIRLMCVRCAIIDQNLVNNNNVCYVGVGQHKCRIEYYYTRN